MSNLINTFDPTVLDGKDFANVLLFFTELNLKATERGFSSFELIINEDGLVDVIGFEQEVEAVHPDTVTEICKLLEPYL